MKTKILNVLLGVVIGVALSLAVVSIAKAEEVQIDPVSVKIFSINEGQVFEQNSFKLAYTAENATNCVYVINDTEKVELPNCEYTEVKLENGEYKLTVIGYNEKFSNEFSVKFVVNYQEPVVITEPPVVVEPPVVIEPPVVKKYSSSGSYVMKPKIIVEKPLIPTYKMGERGDRITKLQIFLNLNGAKLTVDSIYGKKTNKAWLDYQSK